MHHDRPATPSTDTQQPMPPLAATGAAAADALSLAERGRRSVLARAVAGLVAMTLWLGPMQVTLQQAQQAAGVLAAGAVELQAPAVHAGAVRQSLLRWAVAHLPVMLRFGPAQAYAAPITDPSAPVRFTPTITSTTGPGAPQGGVPVVGITTPNAQGISLNQYRAFVVDPVGLILNNSATGGGSFLGGQVGANANLAASGPASLIINQVTSQSPAQINGTMEVFGAPAGLVIAAPGGVYTSGAGFTNTTQVTLTTGTPQFLTAGGAPTSFDTAAAAGFLVQGGRVQIANPAPGNANASGIEGTVGNISLIAESIGIDAALHAGNQINLVAGRQLVTPDAGGFATSAAGANNAATNSSATGGLAIDATAFGAMNAGQIKIVSTAAGLGVRADGSLAASSGNLTLDSAGNLKVGNTYAKQQAALTAAGAVAASGNGLGEAGYSIKAGTDATLGGTLESGRALSVAAGGSITGAGGAKAQDAVTLAAGGSVDIGGVVNGAQVAVQADGNDGRGDIRLRGDVTSPGQIQLLAARDTTIDGNAISAGDLNLSTRRNLTINGAAGSTSGNVALTGVTGSVTTAGNVVSPGTLTVNAGTDVNLGGEVTATGPVSATAQAGSITTSGQIASNADLSLTAAQDVMVGGQAQSAGKTTITAGAGTVTIAGALTSDGDTAISAGQNATVAGDLASGGNTTIQATNGSATVSGALLSMGDTRVGAGKDANLSGSVLSVGNLIATAGQMLTVGALPWVGGNATLHGTDILLGSVAGQSNTIKGTLDVAATSTLTLLGDTQATHVTLAGQSVSNAGTTVATEALTVNGGTITNMATGALVGNAINVSAADLVNRGTLGGQTTNVAATNSLDNAGGLIVGAQSLNIATGALASNLGGMLFAGDLTGQAPTAGDLTLTVTGGNGSFNNAAGQILAGNNLTLNALNQTFDPSAASTGALNANGILILAAQSIHNTGTWNVSSPSVVLDGAQGVSNTGTIQSASALNLSTGGTFANSGQIVGGSNLSVAAGALANTGTVHADGDLALSGNTVNAGVVEALGNVNISGSDYDNRGGTTQAGKDLSANLSGTLNNTGSVIGAVGNVNLQADQIINDQASATSQTSTSQTTNAALLLNNVIGTSTSYMWMHIGPTIDNYGLVPSTKSFTLGDLLSPLGAAASTATTVTLEQVSLPDADGNMVSGWQVVATPSGHAPTQILTLPTVTQLGTTQTAGTSGQIVAGKALVITANTLSNQGGQINAGGDASLNVQTLKNGAVAPALIGQTGNLVDPASLSSFLAALAALPGGVIAPETQVLCPSNLGNCPLPPISYVANPNATPASVTSTTSLFLPTGQISSLGNLTLTGQGDLTNAGNLAALGNLRITTPGTFTNQGAYASNMTTTAGCVAGATTCNNPNPHVDDLTWQQQNNTVAAGQTLTVNAANIQNLNGTLAAQGNVSLTAGSTVTNQAGTIQSLGGDVSITAPTLVNKTMDPVTLHKDYGNLNPPYAGGCNGGGTYKESNCSADETVAAGPAGAISAARDVNLSGTTLANNGALISGGRNVTVNMTGAVDNTSVAQNANWAGLWVEQTGEFSSDKRHGTGGTAVLGSQESLIRASNVLTVTAGGQIQNTGNLMGGQIDMTGAALLNGYTSPNQPTPPTTTPQQVISLAPPAGPTSTLPITRPVNNPISPWQFNPVIVTTPGAPTTDGPKTINWHFTSMLDGNPVTAPSGTTDRAQYLSLSLATAVLAGVTPDSLLAQLPAELRPGNVSFYYDPYTEDQKLQQAALQQTGKDSFINGLAWDSQNQLSVTDQEKLVLYRNAADYAKAHNIALGTALTQQQINELDRPLLWYVEQAVPDPSCSRVASDACPTVNALVPQVYLPEGYAQALTKPTGGSIAGDNIKLDIEGQLRNTGTVTATDTLQVKAGSIEIGPNVVDIGTSAYKAQGGWNEITGTVVQPGGFMSAMHMDIETERIHAVNDAFLIRNADGTVDEAATLALVNQLKANLGLSYTEDTVSDDIHTRFIKETKGFGVLGQIVMMVAAVALAVVTAGAASAAIAAAQIAAAEAGMATLIATGSIIEATAAGGLLASSAFAVGGMANLAIAGALGSLASSAAIQLGTSGTIDLGQWATAGLAGAVTGGLAGYFGSSYGVDRLLASGAAGCGTAAMQGGDCASGAMTGFATAAVAWVADAMRQDQIESSQRFKGVYDTQDKSGTLTSNATGPSAGIDGDGMKIAGTRVSIDDLQKYGTVVARPDGAWDFTGNVINPDTNSAWSLKDALDKEGGLTGGFQGLEGTLANSPYQPGTFTDKVLESFAGPHDYLGSLTAYDSLGNLKEGMTSFQRMMFEIQTDIDIPLAAPFAAVTLLNQYGIDWSTFRNQAQQTKDKK